MGSEKNRDKLTGALSAGAFAHWARELDASEDRQYGAVAVDLNFLKRVNDAYGHEHGDISLKTCVAMLRGAFGPAPVFRIRGDEFAVLVENKSPEELEELIARFREALRGSREDEKLRPWEQVSAAVGAAVFDRERDNGCEDVLKRAERAMFADKAAMKAQKG